MQKVYLNGNMLPIAEARVSAMDAGLLLGAGVFETLRAYDGFVFRLDDHLVRLATSARELDIPLQETHDELADAVAKTIAACGLRDARVRITLTRGSLGGGPEGEAPRATCLVTAGEMTPYPDELYERGMTVTLSEVRVNEKDPLCCHKTTSYMTNLMILRDAHARGAQESLRFNGPGRLAEGSISNVFLVRSGRLLTPPVSEGCLPGVTRKAVLELAAEAGLPAGEEPLAAPRVLEADEVFLTNTIMEVMPVCRVERHALADEKPGPVTRQLMALYKEQVEKERAAER